MRHMTNFKVFHRTIIGKNVFSRHDLISARIDALAETRCKQRPNGSLETGGYLG